MPSFNYSAISQEGEKTSGKRNAKTKQELARQLHKDGYVLTTAYVEGEEEESSFGNIKLPSLFGGVSVEDKLMMVRNLRVMIKAGVALPRALNILAEQSDNERLQKALFEMQENITQGESFSEAMALHSDIFSELFQNMVQVGEESGTLENVFGHLEVQLQREHDLRSKIKGALMYPAVVVTAMFGIGILMLVLVVPQLGDTFDELGVELPATTRFVVGFGDLLIGYWYLMALGVVAAVFGIRYALKTDQGKRVMDTVLLKAPLVSPISHKINSAVVVRTLSSLVASGVPLLRALEITAGTVQNHYFRESLLDARERVRKGEKLSGALSIYEDLYPIIVVQMIQVGEETGQTADILAQLAEFFEDEVTDATQNLASVTEPILMLIIGAAVGFFAISMMQPMYSMMDSVN